MAIRREDLPSDPARLIEMVLSLDAENDRLRTVIDTFKDMVFGARSEKLAAVVADQLARPSSPARRRNATSAHCRSTCRAASN
jgi:hypothetical protein